MDELQAAFLSVFLPNLDSENLRRREIAEKYNEVLKNKTLIQPPKILGEGYVAHLYVIRTENRISLENYFKENSIQTAVHYPIPDYQQPIMSNKVSLGNTEKLSNQVLTLPCRPDFNDSEVNYMLDILRGIQD